MKNETTILALEISSEDFYTREFAFCDAKGIRSFYVLCNFEFDIINHIYVKLSKSPHTLECEEKLFKVLKSLDMTNRVAKEITTKQFYKVIENLETIGELLSEFCELTGHKYHKHLIRLQAFMGTKKSLRGESIDDILSKLKKNADSPTIH